MNIARADLGIVSVGGLIYAVGGHDGEENGETPLASTEVFDPATGVWALLADMPVARSYLALVHVQE